jgi:ribosomal protein L16/L10AE
MALMPKNTKFRKTQRGRLNGLTQRGVHLNFGEYGILLLVTSLVPWEDCTFASSLIVTLQLALRKRGWVKVKVCLRSGLLIFVPE